MKKTVAALFLFFPSLAFAATPEEALGLTPQDCAQIVTYQKAPDVDYQAGVDVNGKAVIPADITENIVTPPETYTFDVTVDLARYMGLSVPVGMESSAKIGTMTYKDGHLTFNGNPVEGNAQIALEKACAAQDKQVN